MKMKLDLEKLRYLESLIKRIKNTEYRQVIFMAIRRGILFVKKNRFGELTLSMYSHTDSTKDKLRNLAMSKAKELERKEKLPKGEGVKKYLPKIYDELLKNHGLKRIAVKDRSDRWISGNLSERDINTLKSKLGIRISEPASTQKRKVEVILPNF